MRLEIHAQNVPVTQKLQAHIERKLQFALDRLGSRVTSVSVHVEDVNGPKGGPDKQCRILAQVKPSGKVVVKETGEDAFQSVSLAAEKIGRAIRKRIDKVIDKRRATAKPRSRSA